MFLSSQDPDDDDDVTNNYLACRRFVLWQLFLFKPSCPSLGIYDQFTAWLKFSSAEVGKGRLISYLISPRVVGGSEDAVHIKCIERLRLWMFMLKISHWLIDCVWLEQSHRVVDRTLLFPGTQVHLGNSWGVTRENAVSERESVNMSL